MVAGKRLGRRGVDAIFTPDKGQRNARFLVGLVAIVIGIVLWTIITLDYRYPKLFGTSEISTYLSTVLASLGLTFVISGSGICLSYSIFNPIYENIEVTDTVDLSRNWSALKEHGRRHAGVLSSNNVKLGLVAFIQSSLALVLYSGLVDEYRSNISMQQWVSSIFPYGQFVLSWEAILVASALFGILVIQFLPGRALAE